MVNSDFLSILWGIIGVLVLLLLIAGLASAGFGLLQHLLNRHRAAIVVGETAPVSENTSFEFGHFERIRGTPYLIAPYGLPTEYTGKFSAGGGAPRNYLIVHGEEQNTRYLLPTHGQIILSLEMLGTGEKASRNAPVQWLYCHIVDTDTNQDGRLTEEDAFSIAFANPDGTGLAVVLREVHKMLGMARLTPESILLFYRSGTRSWMSEIDLPERNVVRTRELPEESLRTPDTNRERGDVS